LFTVVVTDELLLLALGSVVPAGTLAVAVFVIELGADEETVADTLNVAFCPEGRLTVVEMFPVPDAAPHEPVPVALHVHDTPVRPAGIVSATVAPATSDGPLLVTTIV
jgi:hypothetical protein